jgi:hypothetical protein
MKGITMAKSMGKKGTICGPKNFIQKYHQRQKLRRLEAEKLLLPRIVTGKGKKSQYPKIL